MLRDHDYEIYCALSCEKEKQRSTVNLIPSENFVSRHVLQAVGSVFTNKYAEGYPGRRYYGGCEFADRVEDIARRRACQLFNAEHANVQPHSGSQANMAVYFTILKPGDTILSMTLSSGGHLTHGAHANFSGTLYRPVFYGVSRETERIDYDEVRRIALAEKPRVIVCGASAYSRIIEFDRFAEIARECGAHLMADIAHIAGPVAAGLHPTPVGLADFVTTTTHKTLRGPRGGMVFCREEHRQRLDGVIFPGIQGGPLVHVIAGKAVALKEALGRPFARYQRKILRNAARLAAEMAARGYRVVSGGTDNHLMLIDLASRKLTGMEAQTALERVGIIVNKNTIPFDTHPASVAGGIRLGTPAATTRGMGESDMAKIAEWLDAALVRRNDGRAVRDLSRQIRRFAREFPLCAGD